MWVIGVAGALFFLVEVILMAHGIDGMKRKKRLKKGKHLAPRRPWMWDYAWEPRGISENKVKGVINACADAPTPPSGGARTVAKW